MLFLSCFFQGLRGSMFPRKAGSFPRGVALFRAGLVVSALLVSTVGCSKAGDEKGTEGNPDPTPPDPPEEETIAFVPEGTLVLAPSELSSLTVEVSPRRRQNVTFELLTEAAGFDGFLLESEVRVRDDGTATVELRAPSGPAIFTVRASLPEGSRAVRAVSVSAQGYGAIDVVPNYDGTRSIPQWSASAHVNQTCETLDSFWEDGELWATGASRATIENVPSSVPVAVTLRGGQLASGCATHTGLRAGDLELIEVEVNDRPVDVTTGTLSVSLGITSSTAVFVDHLSEAITAGRSYFQGEQATDAAALLLSMTRSLSPANQSKFEEAQADYDLRSRVDEVYLQESPITTTIGRLLGDAAAKITGPDVFRGHLSLQGLSSQFLLKEVVGVEASESGFFQGSTWMVSPDSGDMVVMGGTLSYEPLRWLGKIAEFHSAADTTPEDQILEAANCQAVADAIITSVGGPPFGQCDQTCLSDLCDESVAPVWATLLAEGPPLTTLQVGISGRAQLYGAARIETMSGSWVGRLGSEDETSVGGTAHGALELALEE